MREVSTNYGITTQNIFNAAVSTSVVIKTHTYKEVIFLWIFNKYTMSTSCRISDIAVF